MNTYKLRNLIITFVFSVSLVGIQSCTTLPFNSGVKGDATARVGGGFKGEGVTLKIKNLTTDRVFFICYVSFVLFDSEGNTLADSMASGTTILPGRSGKIELYESYFIKHGSSNVDSIYISDAGTMGAKRGCTAGGYKTPIQGVNGVLLKRNGYFFEKDNVKNKS